MMYLTLLSYLFVMLELVAGIGINNWTIQAILPQKNKAEDVRELYLASGKHRVQHLAGQRIGEAPGLLRKDNVKRT